MTDKRLPENGRHLARAAQLSENLRRELVYVPCQEVVDQSQMTEFARRIQMPPVGATAESISALLLKQLPFYSIRSYECLKRLRLSLPFV
jgi:hypothetical protein